MAGIAGVLALHLVVVFAFQPTIAGERGPLLMAQIPEALPMPPSSLGDDVAPEVCRPVPQDAPLGALTVDIRPRVPDEGELVPPNALPTDCAEAFFSDVQLPSMELACASCRPSLCELLEMARFCHHPLYFQEPYLERYGIRTCCCQPAASAAHFFGSALALPVKMARHCPCSCVPTPPCD